ncbi:hypothetical protein ACIQGZ_29150 [Streptomyces sp. NPDC092296]|uniref:hypothetical protein n=1 Tax=Streptomyces sp. NPDC092296 TaxID=3366012 RepID=UPI00382B8DAB
MQSPGQPSRRRLLAAGSLAGASLALAACTDGTPAPRPTPSKPDPDAAIRRSAADATTALIAAYDAAIAAHPKLAGRLGPLRAHLVQHRAALGTATPPTTPAPAVPTPTGQAATLTALAAAERRTAATRTAALPGASPELARLLASIAASGAVHALHLTN